MIIDFHTHIFPDKLAKRAIDQLTKSGGGPAFSDGSVNGLLAEMERADVDVSVTLPVLTNPLHFEGTNRFAAEICERFATERRRLISFGGIHPACENIEQKMRFLKESGFLGVKIHPDYQGTFIDDEAYVRILSCAREYDMIVVTHAGFDDAYPDMPIRCTPERVLRLLKKAPHSKLVLAHYGGKDLYGQVLEQLCGLDVYFDTAYILRFIGKDCFYEILERHGADRILFASDSPWSSISNDVKLLRSMGLDPTTEEKILSGNAKALLGL